MYGINRPLLSNHENKDQDFAARVEFLSIGEPRYLNSKSITKLMLQTNLWSAQIKNTFILTSDREKKNENSVFSPYISTYLKIVEDSYIWHSIWDIRIGKTCG
jgi:hypothetical protein